MPADYAISARGYLKRAQRNLIAGELPLLFYAAFELRCCVEARQDLYLDAQRKYRRSLPRSWQLGPKARELDRLFQSNRLARVIVHFDGRREHSFHYVPVSKRLTKAAQMLGDDLHCKQRYHDSNDPWWTGLRERLLGIYRDAWFCCQGQLLCPLLVEEDGTTTNGIFDMDGLDPTFVEAMQSRPSVRLSVAYPESPPSEWKCDL